MTQVRKKIFIFRRQSNPEYSILSTEFCNLNLMVQKFNQRCKLSMWQWTFTNQKLSIPFGKNVMVFVFTFINYSFYRHATDADRMHSGVQKLWGALDFLCAHICPFKKEKKKPLNLNILSRAGKTMKKLQGILRTILNPNLLVLFWQCLHIWWR